MGLYHDDLLVYDQLAKKMRADRMKKGGISFESTSAKVLLDKEGHPTDIKGETSHTTHQLIEEFALLANRLVAESINKDLKKGQKNSFPFIYRTHDEPDPQRIADFAQLVRHLGYSFDTAPEALPHSYNKVLLESKNTPYESVIQIMSIRTMSQALYTTAPKGHFGLGFSFYTHFTSPIRRYPDVLVHRLLLDFLGKKEGSEQKTPDKGEQGLDYEQLVRHLSARERLAVEAERASFQVKQVLFMKTLEGKAFDGVVSGLTDRGLYVMLKAHRCEGMVRLSDIVEDTYVFDNKTHTLVGKKNKRSFTIGTEVRIQVKHADIEKRLVDLTLLP